MNAEYQRLEAEASEVQNQIDELVRSCGQMVAADFQKFKAKIAGRHQRLAGLRQGMGLLKYAGSATMQAQAAKLAKSQPKTFHSQGTRPKTVQLTGGVTVTLHIKYYHRFQCPEKAKNKKANRGLFPMLILLGIANGFTAGVRQRMMKCAALLGSYEEAVQMLDDEGIRICVNTLRKVTAGMGEMLARLTKSGSVKVSGDAAGGRIVVTVAVHFRAEHRSSGIFRQFSGGGRVWKAGNQSEGQARILLQGDRTGFRRDATMTELPSAHCRV